MQDQKEIIETFAEVIQTQNETIQPEEAYRLAKDLVEGSLSQEQIL